MPRWRLPRSVRTLRRPAGSTDQGFTLIEVMWALVIFAIVAMVGATTLIQTQVLTRSNRARVAAASIAETQIEQARSTRAVDLVDGAQTLPDVTLNGTDFHVTQQISLVPDDSTVNACDPSDTGAAGSSISRLGYKRVSIIVTWDHMNGVKPVRSDTLRTLGVGDVDQSKGAISVAVRDHAGQPLADQTVTLAPGGGSQTTGPDGCVVFGNLATSQAYTATLNTVGYVDLSGQQQVTQGPITVTASSVSKVRFDYDQAAELDVSYHHPEGYDTFPDKLPITLVSSVFPSNSVKTFLDCSDPAATPGDCVAGYPRAIRNLYPDSQGYEAYAGGCQDAAPQAATQPFGVSPNGQSAGFVNLQGVDVTMAGGGNLPGAIYAIHATGDSRCSTGEILSFQTGGGDTAKLALPYGAWQFSKNQAFDPNAGRVTVTENQIASAVVVG